MADPKDGVPENAPGSYYVDTQCIDCDVCRDTAPANFTRSDENGYSFVFKQPVNSEEQSLCEEALLACPVEAIGNDR
jgi:ferredoxin